jgi:transcriptional antiterminator NusG
MPDENQSAETEETVQSEAIQDDAVASAPSEDETASGESAAAEAAEEPTEVPPSLDSDVEEAEDEEAEEEEAPVDPADLEFSADDIVDDDYDLTEEAGDDSASPIEEFVEEVVEVEETIEMDWYILKVQVNREKGICENLQRQVKKAGMEHYFGEVLVPTEDVREFKKDGKQRITKRKLYPGYVVVNMAINDDSWFLVRETSGIGDFAGASGRPAPLTQTEIDRILQAARPEEQGEEEAIKTAIPFKIGERVRIKEGYFQNYEGDISSIDERNGRIEVMIDIFGRPNPVDMDHWHAEKVN